jgi:hypothetical protein
VSCLTATFTEIIAACTTAQEMLECSSDQPENTVFLFTAPCQIEVYQPTNTGRLINCNFLDRPQKPLINRIFLNNTAQFFKI